MPKTLPEPLEHGLDGLKTVGDQWIARCPLHEDRTPSMTIRITADNKILAHCQAGCDQRALADTLKLADYGPVKSSGEWTVHGDAVAVYDYRDETGKLLFQVLRTATKDFPQRRPDPSSRSGWKWSLGDTRRVLFRLPELIAGLAAGHSVVIAEGEKDVLNLVGIGKLATCNPGGAGKWRPEYAPFFTDADVTIIADKDAPGQAHARTIAASLQGVASRVWIVEAADPHKDISAHLAAGLPMSAVEITRRPEQPVVVDLAPDIHEILAGDDPEYAWLVPGLLEHGDRVLLTGSEGLGKSMWLRMLATCLAAGINPITFSRIEPMKVLMVDCENTLRQNRRKFRSMVEAAEKMGMRVPDGNLRLILKPNGLNLAGEDDAAWLLERVNAHQPDVLVIGPLYRLQRDNPNDETVAKAVQLAIDTPRTLTDCAVIIEAHSGHTGFGQKTRSVRPIGASAWMRWPEFGYGLKQVEDTEGQWVKDEVAVLPWRGPRDERTWPKFLRRSNTGWPWEDASDRELR